MIEIIPNWHPIFVHFTIGAFVCSVIFYLASVIVENHFRLHRQWIHVANWTLWTGCLFAIFTVMAGWHAYNTVQHDSASHAAMMLHRNWALPTTVFFLILGGIAIKLVKRNRRPGKLFLTAIVVGFTLLMATGWLGAEAVYRYGLGVMALPEVEHNHNHPHTQDDEDVLNNHPHVIHELEPVEEHDHSGHQH